MNGFTICQPIDGYHQVPYELSIPLNGFREPLSNNGPGPMGESLSIPLNGFEEEEAKPRQQPNQPFNSIEWIRMATWDGACREDLQLSIPLNGFMVISPRRCS